MRHSRQRPARKTRWAVLALVFISMTGVYYSYNIPAALHQQIQDYMPHTSSFEVRFNMLYSLYSIPNVILPFFGGIAVDRLGAPFCFVGFAILLFLGQLLFATGTTAKSWTLMLIGRLIYGIGGESIFIAQSTLLFDWFEGREVALAFSIAASAPGSVLTYWVTPILANSTSTPAALWVGVMVNMVSVCGALVVNYVDKSTSCWCSKRNYISVLDKDEDMPVNKSKSAKSPMGCPDDSTNEDEREYKLVHLSDIRQFGKLFWLLAFFCMLYSSCIFTFNNVSSGILLERNYFTIPPKDCTLAFPDQCTSGTLQQNGTNPSTDSSGNICPFYRNNAPVLPTSLNITRKRDSWDESKYIFDSISQFEVDCGDLFWSEACTKDYCDHQKNATEEAGRVMSVPYLLMTFLLPALGCLVDRFGCRAIAASLLSSILAMVHFDLAVGRSSPILPVFGLGVAFSLAEAVVWPTVPLTVKKEYAGSAFGIMSALQNCCLAVYPLIVAAIYESNSKHYLPYVEYFFVTCAAISFFTSIALNLTDMSLGGKLNSACSLPLNKDGKESDVEVAELKDNGEARTCDDVSKPCVELANV